MKKSLLGGLFVGAALLLAPAAQADGGSFVQSLLNHGLQVYDAPRAMQTGQQICTALRTTSLDYEAKRLYYNSGNDFNSLADATMVVTIAQQELCSGTTNRGPVGGGIGGGKVGGAIR